MPYDAMRDEHYPVHRPEMLDLPCHNPDQEKLVTSFEELRDRLDRQEALLLGILDGIMVLEDRLVKLERWKAQGAPHEGGPIPLRENTFL